MKTVQNLENFRINCTDANKANNQTTQAHTTQRERKTTHNHATRHTHTHTKQHPEECQEALTGGRRPTVETQTRHKDRAQTPELERAAAGRNPRKFRSH